MNRVKITDPTSKYAGQLGTVTLTYYDHKHTGDSPDLLYINLDNGPTIKKLSTEVEPAAALWPGYSTKESEDKNGRNHS